MEYSALEFSNKYPLKFYYGTAAATADITTAVYTKCVQGDYLVLPPDDNFRSKLFGDPLFGTVKQIIVVGLFDSLLFVPDMSGILIHTKTHEVVRDTRLVQKYVLRLVPAEERIAWLHNHISLDFGTMKDELPEQHMAVKYLTGKEVVLEIGANIGRNSLVIASMLDNDTNLVSMECSQGISRQLRHNRDKNGFKFHIEPFALSERRLFQQGWLTVPADACPPGHTEVPTISYKTLVSKHNKEFDTLILDCEGAFYYILRDTPQILDGIKTIIVENDYRNIEHKEWVDEQLRSRGLKVVYRERGNAEAEYLKMPCLENFYEVWKLDETAIVSSAKKTLPHSINFMKRFPCVYFLRYNRYSAVDEVFIKQGEKLKCAVIIISPEQIRELRNMVDPNYPILVTYGETDAEYVQLVNSQIVPRINRRWIHLKEIQSVESFERAVNYCYIHNAIMGREMTRPVFSIFTTCFKSFDKIERAYSSIQSQRLKDWEWVMLDDSPNDDHFAFLRRRFALDKRVRLYRRSENSGNIGNVKNEAVSLCRGKYVLEMDHDDEILPDTLSDATRAFEEDAEVGFVYMDFINIYPSGKNFRYGDFISFGYGGYYMQKFRGRWAFVYVTPNINNITASHIVSVPNHPRIWRTETLHKLGNYSEFLPICDDLEILMRTIIGTKMVKIPKLAYVQYMNEGGNNFSLIRNEEINRLTPRFISPQFYDMYKVDDKMKEVGAYEDPAYRRFHKQLWLRNNYTPKYCNKVVQYDYDKQFCILGIDGFNKHRARIEEEYKNVRHDFILLSGTGNNEELYSFLDSEGMDRMKCYSLKDTTNEQLVKYFLYLYKSCGSYEVLGCDGAGAGDGAGDEAEDREDTIKITVMEAAAATERASDGGGAGMESLN